MAGRRGAYRPGYAPEVLARITKLWDDYGMSYDGIAEAIQNDKALGNLKRPKHRSAVENVLRWTRPQDFAPGPGTKAESPDYRRRWRIIDAPADEVAAVLPVMRDVLGRVSPEQRDRAMPSVAEARAIHRLRVAATDIPADECWRLARELAAQEVTTAERGDETGLLDVQRYVALELWRDPSGAIEAFKAGMIDTIAGRGYRVERQGG